MSGLRERLAAFVEDLSLVDTHEHIVPEEERLAVEQDLFSWFPHYASSDLVAAGLPIPVLEEIRNSSLPAEEKWAKLAPYWEMTRNTTYCRALLIAAKDLHGVADINADTWRDLSEKIRVTRRPGWYRHVLRERAKIEVSLNDTYHIIPNRDDLDLIAPVRRMDDFITVRSRAEIRQVEKDFGVAIHSLDDLVRVIDIATERAVKQGHVAVKSALAYRRILSYEKVTHAEAERLFNRIPNYLDELREQQYQGMGLSWQEAKPLQDYLMHRVIRSAIDHGLPVQLHTGLQEGNGNIIGHSNPTLLTNLFFEYPQAKFDLFHGGYPYTGEMASLGKNFPNVYVDMCWLPIISPSVARRALHEWIETVPGNKILAFGGDYRIVEGAYGHSRIAREVVSRVLAEKVEEDYFGEEEAQALAKRLLHDNAFALFSLGTRKRQREA
ncbi:MAG: amidohydrolase family protein [Chloroflexota bacterium]